MKEQYEQSLKDQVEKRKNEKEKEVRDNEKFKETWNSKLGDLRSKEHDEEEFRKQQLKKHQD